MDQTVGVAEDANLQRWVLGRERVLVRAAAAAVGAEALHALVAHFKRSNQQLEAAKVEWAVATLGEMQIGGAHGSTAALALIEDNALTTEEAQQLVSLSILFASSSYISPGTYMKELDVLLSQAFTLRGLEQQRVRKRIKELLAGNEGLKVDDKFELAVALHFPRFYVCFGADPQSFDSGAVISEQSIVEGVGIILNQVGPMWEQAVAESVGARQEAVRMSYLIYTAVLTLPFGASSGQAAAMVHERAKVHWGPNASNTVDAFAPYSVARHLETLRSLTFKFCPYLSFAHAAMAMEIYGDARVWVNLFTQQQRAFRDFVKAAPPHRVRLKL